MPLGGDSEEKGDYTSGDPPWGASSQATYRSPQSWGPTRERRAPLAGWRASGTNRRSSVWEAWIPLVRSARMHVCPRSRAERVERVD